MCITSRQNALIKEYRKPDKDSITVEGVKLVSEAVDAGFSVKTALFTEKAVQKNIGLYNKLPSQIISDDLAEYISDTKTPQGIFAVFKRKSNSLDLSGCRRLILLDGVRDPGNAGAIIRSCEAFGFCGIVLSDDSVDAYNSKVIRSAAGSVFRLPNCRGNLPDIIAELKKYDFCVWGTALDNSAEPLTAVNKQGSIGKHAVVIGNEGQGISQNVLELCDRKVYIPITGAESLNAAVAAGIICYEFGT